jgi:hypothetical protein
MEREQIEAVLAPFEAELERVLLNRDGFKLVVLHGGTRMTIEAETIETALGLACKLIAANGGGA